MAVLLIAGSVQNAVKLAQLDEKWQYQKKKGKDKRKEKEELTPEMRELMRYQEDMKQIREGKQMADIDIKLKSGAELTPDEISYLKKNKPEAYKEYEEIKKEKESYKKQLKNCKTKEEVERLKFSKMGNFMAAAKSISQNPNIPKAKKLGLMEKLLRKVMGVNQVHIEFTKSLRFQSLPTEEEKQEEEELKEESVRLKYSESDFESENQIEENEQIEEREGIEEYPQSNGTEESKKQTGLTKRESKKVEALSADFEETKKAILEFMVSNREVGGSFEYMEAELELSDKKGKVK